MVKTPLEAGIGFMRSTGLLVSAHTITATLDSAGMLPTQPPDVDGWSEGLELLSSVAVLEIANIARDAIINRDYQEQELGLDITTLLPNGPQQAADVIDHWVHLLCLEVSTAERDLLLDYMNTYRYANGNVENSPFDPSDAGHLDERLRGLLYILAQHPTFLLS
jgi:hypothetical protein